MTRLSSLQSFKSQLRTDTSEMPFMPKFQLHSTVTFQFPSSGFSYFKGKGTMMYIWQMSQEPMSQGDFLGTPNNQEPLFSFKVGGKLLHFECPACEGKLGEM